MAHAKAPEAELVFRLCHMPDVICKSVRRVQCSMYIQSTASAVYRVDFVVCRSISNCALHIARECARIRVSALQFGHHIKYLVSTPRH